MLNTITLTPIYILYIYTVCTYIIKHCKKKEKFEDTEGVMRSCKLRKGRQYNGSKEKGQKTNNDLQNTTQKTKRKFEDTKGVIQKP